MEDKELPQYLEVLCELVAVVKDKADGNTQCLSAIESGIRSTLNAGLQDFERTYATTMAYGQNRSISETKGV